MLHVRRLRHPQQTQGGAKGILGSLYQSITAVSCTSASHTLSSPLARVPACLYPTALRAVQLQSTSTPPWAFTFNCSFVKVNSLENGLGNVYRLRKHREKWVEMAALLDEEQTGACSLCSGIRCSDAVGTWI